jgi:hypothetical protein
MHFSRRIWYLTSGLAKNPLLDVLQAGPIQLSSPNVARTHRLFTDEMRRKFTTTFTALNATMSTGPNCRALTRMRVLHVIFSLSTSSSASEIHAQTVRCMIQSPKNVAQSSVLNPDFFVMDFVSCSTIQFQPELPLLPKHSADRHHHRTLTKHRYLLLQHGRSLDRHPTVDDFGHN